MCATRIIKGCLAAAAFSLLSASAVFAVDDATAVDPEMAASSGDVPLLSGGVGDDELNYIKSVEHQYNLKVLFTETNGVFLSDLSVSIQDKNGVAVATTVTKGPILLVNLPAGKYTITASEGGGLSHEEKVSVAGRSLRTLQFRFQGDDIRSPEH